MPTGWGNLSEHAELVKNAVEATVDAHPEWIAEGVKEDQEGGKRLRNADEIREDLIIGALILVMRGERGEDGGLLGVTRQGDWRQKISVLTSDEIQAAINELRRSNHRAARRADLFITAERQREKGDDAAAESQKVPLGAEGTGPDE